MKKIIVTAVSILVAANAMAQTGMPKELTCTEEAFNFSFSLGTKWKLGAPKMGPVEVNENGLDYFPVWSLKANDVASEAYLLPSVKKISSVEAFNYPTAQQSYASIFYHNCFSATNKSSYLLPGNSFIPPINYTLLLPSFPVNSISYHP